MAKYRPLLCILFVTLSWGCIRTFAQNTTEGLSTIPAATVLPVSNGIVTTSTKNSALHVTHGVTTGITQRVAVALTQSIGAAMTQRVAVGTNQSVSMSATKSVPAGTTQSATMLATQSVAKGTNQSVVAGTTLSVTMAATKSVPTGTTKSMAAAGTNLSMSMSTTKSVPAGTTQSVPAGTTQSVPAGTTQSGDSSSTQMVATSATHDILAGNTSASQPTTATAFPVSPNITVETLSGNVSRNECRKTQLCAAEPPECDPSKDKSCFFLSARQKNGQNFNFALSGQTDGYIAATVLSDANGKAVTYICANKNKEIRFFSALLENDRLIFTNLSVNSVKGKVNGGTIQCTFLATVPDPLVSGTSRARRATGITLSVSTGSFNATSSSVGTPTLVISTKVDNMPDINATLVNEISPNTTASPGGHTTAFPITTSSAATVPLLLTDVTNSGCGSEKLCAAEPSSCNPAAGGTCSFLSAKQKSGQIFSFELSGLSDGYIASVFSPTAAQGNNDSTYVCAKSNGAVKFLTAILRDNTLSETLLNVTSGSVKGKITGRKIQCVFEAVLPDTANRAAGYSVSILSGTFNLSSGALGTPVTLLRTNVVNLTDPTANVTNLSNTNGTDSGVAPHHQPLTQVLLIPVGVLILTILGH